MTLFVRLNLETGKIAPMSAEGLQAELRASQFTDRVPLAVRMLFEERVNRCSTGPTTLIADSPLLQ